MLASNFIELDTHLLQKNLNSIISPIAYLDKEFNFILVNEAYASSDNHTPEFFPGKNHFSLYPNADNKRIFQNVINSGQSYKTHAKPFEYSYNPERGETYWDWELSPVKDKHNNIQGLILSLVDVTERIKTEVQLSRNLLDQEIIASILKLSLQPLPFEEILRQSLVLALQRTDLDFSPQGVIFLLDPESNELVMTVRHGLPDSIVSSCNRIKKGQCICGMVFEKEQLILTSCVNEDHHITYDGMSEHGHYCVPIKSQDKFLGVLNLYVEHGHKSSRTEVQFVNAIADTLAGIILRDQATKALKDSEYRFRMINKTARDAIVTINSEGNIVSWNGGAESIFGYKHEEIVDKPVSVLMPKNYHKLYKKILKKWISSGKSKYNDHPLEVKGIHKNGNELPIEFLLSSWKIEEKSHLTGIVRDISKRKDAEIKLRQAEVVFENALEGIIVTDSNIKIISVNSTVADITGYKENELIGKPPNIWKSDRHDRHFYQMMWHDITQTGKWKGEIWNRHKDGNAFPCWQTIRVIKDKKGNICYYISIITDISNIKASQEKIEYLAHHDPLTELPNRTLFNARIAHALTKAKRDNHIIAVLFTDLDKFKHINDSFGHDFGDHLLKDVAKRLQSAIREEDTVARLGGDEFAILLENITDPSETSFVAEKLLNTFNDPIIIERQKLHISLSIGISLFPNDAKDYPTLLRNADTAMYKAKSKGINTFQFYSTAFTQEAEKRIKLENKLRQAIQNNEFVLYYQPQYELSTNKLSGVEALIRWQPSNEGLIYPDEFIPLAEEAGLIVEIGRWVMKTACQQIKEWNNNRINIEKISINVSGKQLENISFMEDLKTIIEESECDAKSLEIEITEGFIMQDAELAINYLSSIRAMGIGIAIDDFGTGYSSLSYLKRLPLTKLKIDKSFIMDIPEDNEDIAITRAIIALGKSLGLSITAEGVETQEQYDFLRKELCNEVQGYLYSPAIPSDELIHIVNNKGSTPG